MFLSSDIILNKCMANNLIKHFNCRNLELISQSLIIFLNFLQVFTLIDFILVSRVVYVM